MTSPIWDHVLTRRSGVSVLEFSGELDLACISSMQGLLFDQLDAPDVSEVHVDLARVVFLDSSVLGVLIKGVNYAQETGRAFKVVSPSPAVQRILTVTGLDEVLTGP